ncbi:MAG: diadenylate cyclase CdaA [Bacillota bacterium]|jgi:diadenylate cyclase
MRMLLTLTWQDTLRAVVDIAIVAYLFYQVFVLIRGTRAVQLLKGLAVLFVLVQVTDFLRLHTIKWLLDRVSDMLFVAIPVVFSAEIRRALERLGKGSLFTRSLFLAPAATPEQVVGEIAEAAGNLSRDRTGALIVVQREVGLDEHTDDAIVLDSILSSELLENIFVKNTPLHDGAVIVRGDRIVAAAVFLPSTQESVAIELGARHRAALGITQVSDALAVIVSEETGTISLAVGGRLLRGLDTKTLKEKLLELLPQRQLVSQLFHRGSSR